MADNNKTQEDALKKASQTRREFIRKFGKLAAVTPVALTTLMSPETSAAPKSNDFFCDKRPNHPKCNNNSNSNKRNGFK
ncbi:hypothetical protein E2K93_01660 [Thalassotalea sp. HSM 43]|uniref:hypothetical protein n=1 Tax=Thalassotalea sp. HSM 43 TaxID=2552945 RepID=UPI001080A743|nr:hypothetical protein [Thalassotalea sp. HSM 43]QBY03153.1 hypothetical protein E2K93_01660 [Thalassotalea sp. HSM 43]